MSDVNLTIGDITSAKVDAIVNAANPQMLGGGGVDGAIHAAAGPGLMDACYVVAADNGIRCPIGQARITPAGELPAKWVIHTVGPRYDIDPNPAELLASAYHSSYQLALANQCHSLAVPAISCGVYGYPLDEAAQIALSVSTDRAYGDLAITFYLFGEKIHRIWKEVFDQMSL
jgi:O-acetyl-ADP-ribose deacetylase (regulator of RNase III)